MAGRLTRKQQQANTRRRLLEAAAKVFAERGLSQATIDEVAEVAGYTKGAFYANFASKEELFLAMVEDAFDERLGDIDRAVASDPDPAVQAHRAGMDYTRYIAANPEWERLFFEFAVHGARNEEFRGQLAARYRSLRERTADVYEQVAGDLGVVPPVPAGQIALMTFAMANGVALEKLLEPDAVTDDLFATMLVVFFTGLRALAEDGAPSAAQA